VNGIEDVDLEHALDNYNPDIARKIGETEIEVERAA
jgi:hypothetical protein